MKLYTQIIIIYFLQIASSYGQFPGAAGTSSSTAIFKDSSIFIAWGQTCSVQRGYQNIADTSLGFVTVGDSSLVIGQADGIQVVSLGDGGSAIIGFEKPIKNGPGFDFAVFENGFIDEFLELAFVEVSSDGVNFFRFKATSNTQTDVQMGPFDYNADATLLNNLAGKYRAMYGTPFDLEEMIGIIGLNVDSITHVKVIDVVGSINPPYASYDQQNNMINEHYPTPYPQGGFDLDAIGVIHHQLNEIGEKKIEILSVYPSPTKETISISGLGGQAGAKVMISIMDISCKIITQTMLNSNNTIDVSFLNVGLYFIYIESSNGHQIARFVKD
jgi:hypothetical protein